MSDTNAILHIGELSFSLPKDFSGGIIEALEEVTKYLKEADAQIVASNAEKPFSTIVEILTNENIRLSIRYGFMKKNELEKLTYSIVPRLELSQLDGDNKT